jgi:hypothetical protein
LNTETWENEGKKSGSLNPDWVSVMMGFSPDWTELEEGINYGDAVQAGSGEILQSTLYGSSICQRHAIVFGLFETGTEIPWGLLRSVWGYLHAGRASRRRSAAEQLAKEYPDLVRQLSQYSPPPCSACWADGSWENGLSRLADKIPNRVDRLRALGDAVVPQVVETIGHYIVEVEKTLRTEVEHDINY